MPYKITIEDTTDYSTTDVEGTKRVTIDTSSVGLPDLLLDIKHALQGIGFAIDGVLDIIKEE